MAIQSYVGFTIGPVFEVVETSQRTREIWFASYFFSWFMQELVRKINGIKNDKNEQSFQFLTPFIPEHDHDSQKLAGRYHDRFVASSELSVEDAFNWIKKKRDETIEQFVDTIDKFIREKHKYIENVNKGTVKDVLENYIQTPFVVLPNEEVEDDEVVKTLDQYLNSLELNRSFPSGTSYKTCGLCQTLPAVVEPKIWRRDSITPDDETYPEPRCPLCLLKYFALAYNKGERLTKFYDYRDDYDNRHWYPSTIEISGYDLLRSDEIQTALKEVMREKDQDLDVQWIREKLGEENKDKIKPYHKYIALVSADGDNLGVTARGIGDPRHLSEALFRFAEESEKLIKDYHGEPVYLGGDDVLAFLPTASVSTFTTTDDPNSLMTILDFAEELSQKYKTIINPLLVENGKEANASISIGIALAYYKHPQQFNIRHAKYLLSKRAKSKKNSLAIALLQHSGTKTVLQFEFGKDDTIGQFKVFKTLFDEVVSEKVKIPRGVHHNLARFKDVLINIPSIERMESFFENTFNEPFHTGKKMKSGLDQICNLLWAELESCKNGKKTEKKEAIENILAQLKFLHFLTSEEEER